MVLDHRRIRIAGAAALPVLALLLMVFWAAPASAATFSNTDPITINDFPVTFSCSTGTDGAQATPYPSPIAVSGLPTQTTDVNATINGFSHSFPADARMLLVGPHGQSTELLHEAGGGTSVSYLTITFDDAAATTASDPLVSGTFKPTQATGCLAPNTDYPGPAPANPYGMDLSGFNGTDPNGTWNLYVVDDANEDSGSISGGWSLDITTSAPPTPTPPASTTPAKSEDPKCKHLRKKLKRQQKNLAKATTDAKRAMIQANIADTQSRLKKLGC